MPKLHGDANVRVNIDANGGVNNSDANVEAEIEAHACAQVWRDE